MQILSTYIDRLLLLSIFLAIPQIASAALAPSGEEIVVQLETDCRQIPLYLSAINGDGSFDASYLEKLHAILRFDISQGAHYALIDTSAEKESHAKYFLEKASQEQRFWQEQGASYLILPVIQNQTIALQVVHLQDRSLQTTPFLSLTGQLNQDRKILHRLNDTVHESLTGIPGIAATRILYTIREQKGSDWSSEVWESDYDGANPSKIITGTDYCLHPIYVPPKQGEMAKTILYVSYGGGQPRIYYASRQEGKGYRVSNLKGIQLTPAISAQRDQIAYICDITGSPDLFVQPFDPITGKTEQAKRVFHAKGTAQSSPSFHPNGRSLTFTSDKDGSPQIYLLSLQETHLKPKLISRRARNGSAPSFSPDGTKIAFSSKTAGIRQIWIYDCLSQEEQQLTFSPGDKENPSWAPDSLHLIYNGTSPGDYELYLLDLNKMKPTRLNLPVGEKRFPCWEPRFISCS